MYVDTSATAQASFGGKSGTLGLTVLDTTPDNFGSCADDDLGDAWQVPDFDGVLNLLEFPTALNPTPDGRHIRGEGQKR